MGVFVCLIAVGCAGRALRPNPPTVTLSAIRLVELGLIEQRYSLRLRVENPNSYALKISSMRYRIELNDKEFVHGVRREPVAIPGNGEALVDVEVISRLAVLLGQLQGFAKGDEYSLRYRLSGDVTVLGGSLTIPFQQEGVIGLNDG